MSFRSGSSEHASLLGTMLRRIGAAQADLEGRSFGPQTHQGPMVISGDPARDTLGSRRVTVESVRHLKELVGIPDERVRSMPEAGEAVRYPAAPRTDVGAAIDRARSDGQALEDLIHPDDRETIDLALHAYVMGDSDRVRLHEPLIDALRFPAEFVVAIAQDLTVTAANPLTIEPDGPYVKDPALGAVAVFGTVTVKSGGSIQISIPAYVTADRLVFEGPELGLIKVVGIDGIPGKVGADGGNGANGADATGGEGAMHLRDPRPMCMTEPTAAGRGGDGGSGQPGTPGGDGDCRASWVTVVAGDLSGRILVQVIGGCGGWGGWGGKGGKGGDGGAGTYVAPDCSGVRNPETGMAFGQTIVNGLPGRGGNGGNGGDGGNAARLGPQITILYTSLAPDSEWNFDVGRFGVRGMYGSGGNPGWGGLGGYDGRQGTDGRIGTGTPASLAPMLLVRPQDPSRP